MTRQLRSLIVAVLALLVLCAPVRAAPFTPGLERAYGLALHYWGAAPNNCESLDRQIVPDTYLPEGIDGWATVALEPTPCALYVRRELAAPRNFAWACTIMTHEVGHLLGYEHSADPNSIMYPEIQVTPGICARAALRAPKRKRDSYGR